MRQTKTQAIDVEESISGNDEVEDDDAASCDHPSDDDDEDDDDGPVEEVPKVSAPTVKASQVKPPEVKSPKEKRRKLQRKESLVSIASTSDELDRAKARVAEQSPERSAPVPGPRGLTDHGDKLPKPPPVLGLSKRPAGSKTITGTIDQSSIIKDRTEKAKKNMQSLPKEARPETVKPGAKSYRIHSPSGKSTIEVHTLTKHFWLIKRNGKDVFSNRSIIWGDDAKAAWKEAKQRVKWS